MQYEKVDVPAFIAEDITPRFPNGKLRGSGPWIDAPCPNPAHKNGQERNASFGYNSRTGAYRCHACGISGGTLKALCALMGVPHPFGSQKPRSAPVLYSYTDEKGDLLFQVVRHTPKRFQLRRPDGNGGWIWSVKDVRPVLYRLPEVLAAPPDTMIYVVEGEKDANRLAGLGLVATTCSMGAGKWLREYNEMLRGRHVVILPDSDEAGREHAVQVEANLHGLAASIRVVPLPNLPEKGDVSDWIDAGGTREELENLVCTSTPLPSTPTLSAPAPITKEQLTDAGNARRLASLHGHKLHYCYAWKTWLFWDGKRWVNDAEALVERLAKDVAARLFDEADKLQGQDLAKEVQRFAKVSGGINRIHAMIGLAQSEPGIAIRPDELDADPSVLNCLNGTLDLRRGQLRPHAREDLITKIAPVVFEPTAQSQVWDDFLHHVTDGDTELLDYLQRAAGYSLTGDTGEQAFFVIEGPGATGKSTLLEVLKTTMGDYAMTANFDTFLAKKSEAAMRNDLARLAGARLVTAAEVERGRSLSESVVKTFTGQDRITARFMYKENFEFQTASQALVRCKSCPPHFPRRRRHVATRAKDPLHKRDSP